MSSLFPENKANKVPSKFRCALSGDVMERPLIILGSSMPVSYEQKNLEAYFENNGYQDPYDKKEIEPEDVRENVALKREIEIFTLNNPHLWGTEIPLSANAKV